MYRYELKCKECGTTIGYMSSLHKSNNDNYVFSGVWVENTYEPICCPICEVRRLKVSKNENT